MSFIRRFFNVARSSFTEVLPRTRARRLHIVHVMNSFRLRRTILQHCLGRERVLSAPFFLRVQRHFRRRYVGGNCSRIAANRCIGRSSCLVSCLTTRKVRSLDTMALRGVCTCVQALTKFACGAMRRRLYSLHTFFHFLCRRNVIAISFTTRVPVMGTHGRATVPSM